MEFSFNGKRFDAVFAFEKITKQDNFIPTDKPSDLAVAAQILQH